VTPAAAIGAHPADRRPRLVRQSPDRQGQAAWSVRSGTCGGSAHRCQNLDRTLHYSYRGDEMKYKDAHSYFLRTTTAPDGKAYATLDEARLALDDLINRQSELAISVMEQGDGKWLIRQNPTGSIKIWIEDADGKTIRLK